MELRPDCMKLGAATDSRCRRSATADSQNVFVYVKDGLGNRDVPGAVDAGRARPEGLPYRPTCSAFRSARRSIS